MAFFMMRSKLAGAGRAAERKNRMILHGPSLEPPANGRDRASQE